MSVIRQRYNIVYNKKGGQATSRRSVDRYTEGLNYLKKLKRTTPVSLRPS